MDNILDQITFEKLNQTLFVFYKSAFQNSNDRWFNRHRSYQIVKFLMIVRKRWNVKVNV